MDISKFQYNNPLRSRTPRQFSLISTRFFLPPTKLSFRYWPYPADREVDANGNDTNDPKHLSVCLPIVPENDGKYDATKVACRACEAAHHPVRVRMHMGHESEICPVAPFEEEGHAGHQPEHSRLVLTVQHTNDDEEHARQYSIGVQHCLLRPHTVRTTVREIRYESAERTRHAVEQAEHGCPVARFLKT